MTTEELIKEIRRYAKEHYGDGWDLITETYSDQSIADVIGRTRTLKSALAKLEPIIARWREQTSEGDREQVISVRQLADDEHPAPVADDGHPLGGAPVTEVRRPQAPATVHAPGKHVTIYASGYEGCRGVVAEVKHTPIGPRYLTDFTHGGVPKHIAFDADALRLQHREPTPPRRGFFVPPYSYPASAIAAPYGPRRAVHGHRGGGGTRTRITRLMRPSSYRCSTPLRPVLGVRFRHHVE